MDKTIYRKRIIDTHFYDSNHALKHESEHVVLRFQMVEFRLPNFVFRTCFCILKAVWVCLFMHAVKYIHKENCFSYSVRVIDDWLILTKLMDTLYKCSVRFFFF